MTEPEQSDQTSNGDSTITESKHIKTKKVCRPLTDEEYEDIFSAVLLRSASETVKSSEFDELMNDESIDNGEQRTYANLTAVEQVVPTMIPLPDLAANVQEMLPDGSHPDAYMADDSSSEHEDEGEEAMRDTEDAVNHQPPHLDLDQLPDDIRAEILQWTNEITPQASDTEIDKSGKKVAPPAPPPPKPKPKKVKPASKALPPKQLEYKSPLKKSHTGQSSPVQPKPDKKRRKSSTEQKELSNDHHGSPYSFRSSQDSCLGKKEKDVKKVSKKTVMQERNIIVKGTWVQCCNNSCLKWRYLKYVHDPAEVPYFWTCSMNTDREGDSCDKPETDWDREKDEEEFVFTKYAEGSLVWARMAGYPWWPAMVEIDPDYDTYFECQGFKNIASHYHVVFFDEKVSRAWVNASKVKPFYGRESAESMGPVKIKSHDYRSAIATAKTEAMNALKMSLKERLHMYSFSKRFNGKWSGVTAANQSDEDFTESKRGTKKQTVRKTVKKKRTRKSDGESVDQILDKAEAVIMSAEEWLDEILSSQHEIIDSDYTPDEQQPKKRHKSDASQTAGQQGGIRDKKEEKKSKSDSSAGPVDESRQMSKKKNKNKESKKPESEKSQSTSAVKQKFRAPKLASVLPKLDDNKEEEEDKPGPEIKLDPDIFTMELDTQPEPKADDVKKSSKKVGTSSNGKAQDEEKKEEVKGRSGKTAKMDTVSKDDVETKEESTVKAKKTSMLKLKPKFMAPTMKKDSTVTKNLSSKDSHDKEDTNKTKKVTVEKVNDIESYEDFEKDISIRKSKLDIEGMDRYADEMDGDDDLTLDLDIEIPQLENIKVDKAKVKAARVFSDALDDNDGDESDPLDFD